MTTELVLKRSMLEDRVSARKIIDTTFRDYDSGRLSIVEQMLDEGGATAYENRACKEREPHQQPPLQDLSRLPALSIYPNVQRGEDRYGAHMIQRIKNSSADSNAYEESNAGEKRITNLFSRFRKHKK